MDTQCERTPYISKSQFISGLQCHKSLWLHRFNPELRDEIPADRASASQQGTDLGTLARQLFPGGIEIPYEGLTPAEQIEHTCAEMDRGTATIYEATFCHDGIFVKADILHRGRDGWELYEVKSSTGIKDDFLNDIALQYHVAIGADITITRTSLIYINNRYVRNGEIEVEKLFAKRDVTAKVVAMQGMVDAEIARMREMLTAETPSIDIGPHCSKPYVCDFRSHCWSHIPENSVFDLGGNGVNKFALYRQGIVRLEDVPLDILKGGQRIEAETFQTGDDYADIKKLRSFLAALWYPLCFLDFETTYMMPVPLFDGTRPYQQVPFQYSLHILDHEGGELRHCEFLAESGEDPQSAFIASLLAVLPEGACILTWNQTFEVSRLKELAARFPEHATEIGKIVADVRDLMAPFRSRHIYLPKMKGSHSIKVVLPALVPELGYDGLEVNNGALAAEAYLRMRNMDDPCEIARIRSALLEYCKLDTLAMVRILEKMREIVK